MTILLDSNVVIDLATNSEWADWVADQLESMPDQMFAVNQIVFGETAFVYRTVAELDDVLVRFDIEKVSIPWMAAFRASRAFADYRARGGTRSSLLPDFYIGAHAEVSRFTLLTRDARRYRTYFPDVAIVAPG